MSLNGLPDEVLLSIIGHFAESEIDLATLCLTSRHLRSLTTPLLYQKLCCRDDNLVCRRVVPLTLRSLVRDRELGKFVRVLDISPRDSGYIGPLFDHEDKILIQKAVTEIVEIGYSKQHYGFSVTPDFDKWRLCKKWWEEACEGKSFAMIAIILFLCPGLRQIYYLYGYYSDHLPNDREDNYVEWFFRVVRHSQQATRDGMVRIEPGGSVAQGPKNMTPMLPNLRHGKFAFRPKGREQGDWGNMEVTMFIQTPSAESLYLNGFIKPLQARPDFLMGLKSLTLQQCIFEASVLGNILQACVRLEYFSYSHGYPWTRFDEFDPLLMMEGLLSLSGSLRKLRLARGIDRYFKSNSARDSKLGSLASFKALTHLALPVEFLVGMAPYTDTEAPKLWELVPKSLEYLLVGGLEAEVMLDFAQKEVLELVKRKQSIAPKLTRIILQNIDPIAAGGCALSPLKRASRENEVSLSTYDGKTSEDSGIGIMLRSMSGHHRYYNGQGYHPFPNSRWPPGRLFDQQVTQLTYR
ncbi:hypothetical protein V495_01342 [Pseudogymnoascus sp. VKM F-4514 (FW-929)]|nr:hypothetical protein V495_01342 [Pseudogymnoascus sp. VKM F-4514 (FW-929)]KFY63393.1 hypothetical protein V497_02035 [Pseudogymnoascus sp. VKM F-4516 (FW-969)]